MNEDFKEIRKNCKKCHSVLRLKSARDIQRKLFCSRKCLASYNAQNNISGMRGKKHSIETIQKMKLARAKKDYKGSNNPMFGKKRIDTSIMVKAMWQDPKFRLKMQEKMKHNNPMFNIETKNKMIKTKLERTEKIMPIKSKMLYLDKKHSVQDLSEMYGISGSAITKWLRRNNVNIRPGIFHLRSEKYTCDDGHIADSSFERNIDNWLFHHGLPHAIHYKVFPERKMTADFKVGDILIECDGLLEKRPSKKHFEEKLNLYKNNNINFTIIKINDNINIKLSLLLERDRTIQSNLKNFLESANHE